MGRAVPENALYAGSDLVRPAIDGDDDRQRGRPSSIRLREARPTEDAVDDRHPRLRAEQEVAAAGQWAVVGGGFETGVQAREPLVRILGGRQGPTTDELVVDVAAAVSGEDCWDSEVRRLDQRPRSGRVGGRRGGAHPRLGAPPRHRGGVAVADHRGARV